MSIFDDASDDTDTDTSESTEETETAAADTDPPEEGAEAGEGEEGAEASAEGTETPGEPAPEAEPDESVHKVTIDGKEQDVTLRDLKRIASHKLSAEARFREAAKIRRESETKAREASEKYETLKTQANDLVAFVREDPEQALIQLGVNPYELAQKLSQKVSAFEKLSPEEKKLYQERQRLQQEQRAWKEQQTKAQREAEARAKREKEAAEAQEMRQHQERFVDAVHDHLDDLKFPDDDRERAEVISAVAGLMRRSLEAGEQIPLDLHVRKAIASRTQHRSVIGEQHLKSLPTEKLLELIGPEKVRELRAKEARESAKKQPVAKPAVSRPRQRPKAVVKDSIEGYFD